MEEHGVWKPGILRTSTEASTQVTWACLTVLYFSNKATLFMEVLWHAPKQCFTDFSGSPQCQYVPCKLRDANVLICSVFAPVLKCVHTFLVRLWWFYCWRTGRICAPWLHLRSSVQPPRGQECWSYLPSMQGQASSSCTAVFPSAQLVVTLSSPQ